VKDWECHCGKYKRIRYRGVICDRCGVEVTLSKVRRERMGHIELAVPVAHIWFFKTLPSPMGNLLDMTLRDLGAGDLLHELRRHRAGQAGGTGQGAARRRPLPSSCAPRQSRGRRGVQADIGAPAVRSLLERLNVDKLADELREAVAGETSQHRKKQQLKRLKIVDAFRNSGNAGRPQRPALDDLDVVPVIPDLRPWCPLDGGARDERFERLYRPRHHRNNRLQS